MVVHAFLGAAFHGRIAGGGLQGGDGGEVVAEAVAVDAAGFPAAVALRFFRKAGLLAEAGEQAVGVHIVEEVAGVDILTLLEGAGQEVDVVEREWLGGGRDRGGVAQGRRGDESGKHSEVKACGAVHGRAWDVLEGVVYHRSGLT